MSDTGQAETPMSDHVARFWKYLETETVRIVLDLKRTVGVDAPDGPVVYWDGASFPDVVAKAIVAARFTDQVQQERNAIASKARTFAACYEPGSDGRNTFILLAEWIEAR